MPPRIPECTPLVFEIEIHKILKPTGGKSKEVARKEFEKSVKAREMWEKEQDEGRLKTEMNERQNEKEKRQMNEGGGSSITRITANDDNDNEDDSVKVKKEDGDNGDSNS